MSRTASATILDEIDRGENLFSLPTSLHKVLQKLGDENTAIDDLAKVIQCDPALSATVLRVANSPYYHRISEVRDLSQAVMTLGGLKVKTIALTASILDPKHLKEASGVNPIELIVNAITVASIAHRIARETGYKRPEDALMAGLLHDLGTMYFLNSYSEEYAQVVRRCADGEQRLEVEREIFGVTHAVAGRVLAERWKLPPEIVFGIESHHGESEDSDSGDQKLNWIIQLAVSVVGDSYIDYPGDIDRELAVTRKLQLSLDLSDAQVQELVLEASASAGELAREFDLDIGSMDVLIERANRKLGEYLCALERLYDESEELCAVAIEKEREQASGEARVQTVAALSDVINNAAMVILGRAETLGHGLNVCLGEPQLSALQAEIGDICDSVEKIKGALASMSEVGDLSAASFTKGASKNSKKSST